MGITTVNDEDYKNLDRSFRLNRKQFISNDVSNNLYATLMLARDDGSGDVVKDLLLEDKETLSEQDKERILYTLDYLRMRGCKSDIFKLDDSELTEIKSFKTTTKRTERLIELIIEKACSTLSIADDDKNEFKEDLKQHVNVIINGRNAEVGNKIAEEISLTMYTTKRARYYGKRIQNVIDKNKDSRGTINWEKCYIDVIKYANYATMPVWKRTATRYIVPIKFGLRDINKQVGNTLKALEKKVNESTDKREMFSIKSIYNNLSLAYDYYREKAGVDNTSFSRASDGVIERIAA